MGCKSIFYLLLICLAMVDCLPYPNGLLSGFTQGSSLYAKPQLNLNPLLNVDSNIRLGLPNPRVDLNINGNLRGTERQFQKNHFYNYGQQYKNYDSIAATANLNNVLNAELRHQHRAPTPYGANKAWWNPGLHRPQHHHYGKPLETNNLVQSYAKSYVNQGGYNHNSPNFQLAGVNSKPLISLNSYNHEWLPQQQRNKIIRTVNPVEYLPWPIPDNEKLQPISSLPNVFKIPLLGNNANEDFEITHPVSLQLPLDSPAPNLTSHQTSNNQTPVSKHYIIVHMNGTHEHTYNLDNIVMDSSNVAHIKSKDALNQVQAIIEVEESTETKEEFPLEFPYDTGITKIPRDTNWDKNDHYHPGTLKNPFKQIKLETAYDMKYFKPEYIMPIQSTTENIIGSTTYSSLQVNTANGYTNSGKNSSIMYVIKENTHNTTGTTIDISDDNHDDSGIENNVDSTSSSTSDNNIINITIATASNNVVDISADDTSPQTTTNLNNEKQKCSLTIQTSEILQKIHYNFYDYEDIGYNEETEYNTQNTNTQTTQHTSTNDTTIEDNSLNNTQSYNFSEITENKQGYGYDKPVPKEIIELDITRKGKSKPPVPSVIIYEEVDPLNGDYENRPDKDYDSPAYQDPPKLREDLKVDASELKTVLDKPVFWFRPDDQFWEKVTQGDGAFDQISFYDVQCKPKLVERVKTINHYANGTEIVDYVETIWDSIDDKNPREIKSKREFREPEN